MKITVNKDNVKIEEFDVVHEGEHRVNKCSFSFSEEYTEELVKKAIFTSQNSSVEVAIINNECDIPTEILKARNIVLLGVYAYKVVDDKLDLRYSPSPDAFKVNSGSYIEDASESEEITPSQFEQYMQALNDGLNKVEESLKKMDSAISSANDLVDNINQKLENGDFIGPEGPQGPQGGPGKDGKDGVGITTITSGQSTVEEDKTITPITVNKTDGSSESFNVEAKNGINGQDGKDGKDGVNGQDGLTPSIGENGNWFIGDTDTGKPSRGEVGPTPDLTDYVKNTDYAKDGQGGVISTGNHFRVYSNNGVPYVNSINSEQYSSSGDNIFISKGTLENIKDDYVGSSSPLITLNNTLDNLVRKNRVSDYIVSLKDALKYKVFEFLVHGKTQQKTTTGKNKFDISSLINRTQTIGASTGNIYTLKPNTQYTVSTNMVTSSSNDSIAIIGTPQSANAFIFVSSDTTIEIISSNTHGVGTINNISRTLMTDDTGNIFVGIRESASSSLSDLISKGGYVQIEEGNVATSDEPYTGGQPSPSPDYPQEITTLTFDKITRCGKNLATENFANQNSSINLARTLKTGEKITIVVNMTVVDNSPVGYGMNIYDQDNEQLWGNSYSNWQQPYDGWNSFVVTVKNDTSRLRINAYGYREIEIPTAVLSGALVEENKYVADGSLYEPYQGQTYSIDLQGNEMVELPNGVKDELVVDKYGNVSLVKNVGKIVLNGSEIWELSSFTNNTILSAFYNINTMNYLTTFITDRFKYVGRVSAATEYEYCSTGGQSIRIGINKSRLTSSDIDGFKQWLQENNVEVYYKLATPQTIPLGTLSELITTEEGINTFFINGNLETTLEVLYARDSEKYLQQYIDDKLATLSQALIEEG